VRCSVDRRQRTPILAPVHTSYMAAKIMDAESSPGRRFLETVMSEIEHRLRTFAAVKVGWAVTKTSPVSLTLAGPAAEEHNFLVGLANAWDPVQEDGDLVGIHVACGPSGARVDAEYPYSLFVRGIVGSLLEIGDVSERDDVPQRVAAIIDPYLAWRITWPKA
jgi:hypothetical protein